MSPQPPVHRARQLAREYARDPRKKTNRTLSVLRKQQCTVHELVITIVHVYNMLNLPTLFYMLNILDVRLLIAYKDLRTALEDGNSRFLFTV